MAKKKGATGRILHDPIKDKLVPIYPLDLSRIRTIDDLVRAMGQTAFTARQIGDAADVLEAMARDKDCFGVMTLSGAMTVAKMALVFCDLVEAGIIKAIVSTGALMAHGLVEAEGLHHYRYDEKMNDRELFAAGYNRVYDSLEPETNLDHVEETMQHILENWDAGRCAVQLEDQSEDRRVSFEAYEGAGNSENMLRAQGAGVCPSVYRLRVGD